MLDTIWLALDKCLISGGFFVSLEVKSSFVCRPIYAGNAFCTVRYTGAEPCMLTIRSTSFPVPLTSANSKSDVAPISQVDLSTFGEGLFIYFSLKKECIDIFLGLFMVL